MADPQLPEGRYGSRARKRSNRLLRWSLSAVALVVSVGVALVAYSNLGSAPIEANRLTYQALDDNSLRITLEVRRDFPQRPAVCVVRARSLDGTETGRKEILVPPSEGTAHPVTVVTTSAPPVSGNVHGCSYTVPEYLSTPTRPSG
ncbi:DUF4307 domain-containing protein [Halopolyspora algeriensis]|uniref:DUF4307 domain-containing protein n=1 Tax=Halopolyspora algeriensis TaxID=1500506 RepID=UPI00211EAB20|nr:DUF4307 domain-containing protein [Halopolyspora algeriensis]